MKGYPAAAVAASAAKQRRWKWLALAILLLVFFSMLVPLAFLLGLHNGFPVGYSSDESPPSVSFQNYEHAGGANEQNSSEGTSRVEQMLRNFAPSLPLDIGRSTFGEGGGLSKNSEEVQDSKQPNRSMDAPSFSKSEGVPKSKFDDLKEHSYTVIKVDGRVRGQPFNHSNFVGTEKSCQVEFGSYCLWSKEHKVVMKDATVKRLKDQLFVARAYYPSIAKLQGKEDLSRELKQNIQEHERMLSEAISDADLPQLVENKILKMEQIIAKAKGCTVECSNVERKLRQILDLTEDETHFHMKQSAFLYHLGVQTMPKSLHCLSIRLTVEYFRAPSSDIEATHAHKFDNPSFRHYVIFSRDILAVSATVNSTVMSSKDAADAVFHIITDRQNFYAMKFWFFRNSYRDAVIHVLNIEDIDFSNLNGLGLKQFSPSEEFRISVRSFDQPQLLQMKTEYVSIFGHSHFLLPEIFKNLKKVIVLDDDVIIQKDLSPFWNIDLEGKINGAVNFCNLRFGQLENFFGTDIHDGSSCLWMSGLNIIDLEKWRELKLTDMYQNLIQKILNNDSEETWRTAALTASLLAFQDQIFPLENSLIISGLGYDYRVNEDTIRNAVALHYNGNMKPWLDLGIPAYKKYWKMFLTQGDQFMDECNVRH